MQLTAHMDVKPFQDALAQFIRTRRVDLPKAFRYQGRLLLKQIIDFTPPTGKKSAVTPQAQGKLAVASQIRKLFFGLRKFDAVRERALTGSGAVPLFKTTKGEIVAADPARLMPNASQRDLAHIHHQHRNRRGQVRSALRDTDQLGVRVLGKFVVPESDLRTYIKSAQGHVGRARGGWSAAYAALGGKPAGWYGRLSGVGTVEDKASDPVNGYIRAENKSEWATAGDEDRIIHNAMQSRAVKILADIAAKQQQAAAKAFKG